MKSFVLPVDREIYRQGHNLIIKSANSLIDYLKKNSSNIPDNDYLLLLNIVKDLQVAGNNFIQIEYGGDLNETFKNNSKLTKER